MDTLVFVLCLNHSAITRVCIESLLNTVPKGTEIVVFDNGSTDRTPKMLASFGDKITVIRSKTNLGAPRAVNRGKNLAGNRLFCKMANDHIMTPGWLDKIIELQEKKPGIYSPITIDTPAVPSLKIGPKRKQLNAKYFNNKQATLPAIRRYLNELYPNGMDKFQAKVEADVVKLKPRLNGVWTGIQVIHPEIIERVGYMDERFGMHFGADYDYIYRTRAHKYPVHALNHFVHHFGSFTLRKGCSGWTDLQNQSYSGKIMSEPNSSKQPFLSQKHQLAKAKINEYEVEGVLHRSKIERK